MVFHAQCSYYTALLEAGVRIYLPAPAVLHRHFGRRRRGRHRLQQHGHAPFALNYEVSLMVTGGDIVQRFREVEDVTGRCPASSPRGVGGRSRRATYVDNAMRLTSALQDSAWSWRRMVLHRTSATTTTSKAMTASPGTGHPPYCVDVAEPTASCSA